MNDAVAMHRCLQLAQKGTGLVGINPLVGAVLVRGETVIAEGYYRGPGTDHAEVNLITLRQAQDKKIVQHFSPEDRLYVNLEPCNHHGKTPPCTQAIIDAGIKHVVVGMIDPDKRVAGKGIAALRASGIIVTGPVLRAACERLNRGYISLRSKGRPYITLKKAQTIEGKVANDDGTKLCITSDAQNTWSHTYLRTTHDAILVGVQTVITDDPQLTIRIPNHQSPITNHQPIRIILDPHLNIPVNAKVVGKRTIIVKDAEDSEESKEEILKQNGATVLSIPMKNSHFDWDALWKALATSPQPPATILVEGGPKTWEVFRESGIVDEEIILVGCA